MKRHLTCVCGGGGGLILFPRISVEYMNRRHGLIWFSLENKMQLFTRLQIFYGKRFVHALHECIEEHSTI